MIVMGLSILALWSGIVGVCIIGLWLPWDDRRILYAGYSLAGVSMTIFVGLLIGLVTHVPL